MFKAHVLLATGTGRLIKHFIAKSDTWRIWT